MKGVFGRIGSGVKNVVNKVWQNRDKIADAARAFVPSGYVDKGLNVVDRVHGIVNY